MQRNYEEFPDDGNGDVLWKLASNGDNLSLPREINFSIVFPSEQTAMDFAIHLLRNDQKVSFSRYEGKEGFSWQVEVHPILLPTHENISSFEALLESDSKELGGLNDGWGCFQQN